ncbi:hypothetical protein MG293_010250 [Ovis ammon polii]|uniref:Uncharacterized protein n=1 Tax=Ovis ammon polii TaxID=230172 RepID=A0AAD4UA68_OVIAM|nr:hypothetical protein MG293_010250 [Ovis ammon polii]
MPEKWKLKVREDNTEDLSLLDKICILIFWRQVTWKYFWMEKNAFIPQSPLTLCFRVDICKDAKKLPFSLLISDNLLEEHELHKDREKISFTFVFPVPSTGMEHSWSQELHIELNGVELQSAFSSLIIPKRKI